MVSSRCDITHFVLLFMATELLKKRKRNICWVNLKTLNTKQPRAIYFCTAEHRNILMSAICFKEFCVARTLPGCANYNNLGNLRKTVEDGDGIVGKTIKLITQDKKRTWICEIKLTFVPSCSQMRRQLLHFQVVCKTWSIFQQLSSNFSFRKTHWRQLNFSENRNKQCNQSKYMLKKHKDYVEIFLLLVLDCFS